MRYMRFLLLCLLLLLPLNSAYAQSTSIPQIFESDDQALSVRTPAHWVGIDATSAVNLPIYNHVIVAGDSESAIEAMLVANYAGGDMNAINGKAGLFVSINRQVFQELTGEEGNALNVFTVALLGVQQRGYTYEGPIEYQLGDTTAYAVAIYYGEVASFSMLFERGGLLMGGDLYTNNPNPVEDVPLFLEMFNSLVAPSENRQATPTQNTGMLSGLTNQQPPVTNLQPTTAPQPTAQPLPTNTPRPTQQATGNAGPMLTQLQGQQAPPPPPQAVTEDGLKPIASLNGRFQAVIPQDWVLMENTNSEGSSLYLFLTNNEAELRAFLEQGIPMTTGVFIFVLTVDDDFSSVTMPDLLAQAVSLLPEGTALGEQRIDIVVDDAPGQSALFATPTNQMGLVTGINFGNGAMVVNYVAPNDVIWDAFLETYITILGSFRFQH